MTWESILKEEDKIKTIRNLLEDLTSQSEKVIKDKKEYLEELEDLLESVLIDVASLGEDFWGDNMTWENEIRKEYRDLTKLGLIRLVDLVEDAIKDLDKIEDILDDLDEGDEIELSKLAKNVVVVLNLLADNKKGIKELIDDRADRFW